MAGKSGVAASEEQKAGLRRLAASRDRGEAHRSRALLLTLSGWTSQRIAEAFGVREDTVRLWRSDFKRGGVEALEASPASGPAPVKAEAALRVVAPLLEAPVADRHNWTLARLIGEIEAREGVTLSKSRLSKVLRKKIPLASAATHPVGPPGPPTPSTASASGWRCPRRRRRPAISCSSSPTESEALTHPYLAGAWAKRGADLRVPAPGQAKKVAMMGALDHAARQLVVHTSKTRRSADFIALLGRLDGLYGPRPDLPSSHPGPGGTTPRDASIVAELAHASIRTILRVAQRRADRFRSR